MKSFAETRPVVTVRETSSGCAVRRWRHWALFNNIKHPPLHRTSFAKSRREDSNQQKSCQQKAELLNHLLGGEKTKGLCWINFIVDDPESNQFWARRSSTLQRHAPPSGWHLSLCCRRVMTADMLKANYLRSKTKDFCLLWTSLHSYQTSVTLNIYRSTWRVRKSNMYEITRSYLGDHAEKTWITESELTFGSHATCCSNCSSQ